MGVGVARTAVGLTGAEADDIAGERGENRRAGRQAVHGSGSAITGLRVAAALCCAAGEGSLSRHG